MCPHVAVLDVGARSPLQVHTLSRIERHPFTRIDAKNEVFECGEAYLFGGGCTLLCRLFCDLSALFGICASCLHYLLHQIIGVHDSSLTGFHLSGRQVDHAVSQVIELIRVGLAEFVKCGEEGLKVVVLLIACDVDHAIHAKIFEALMGRA